MYIKMTVISDLASLCLKPALSSLEQLQIFVLRLDQTHWRVHLVCFQRARHTHPQPRELERREGAETSQRRRGPADVNQDLMSWPHGLEILICKILEPMNSDMIPTGFSANLVVWQQSQKEWDLRNSEETYLISWQSMLINILASALPAQQSLG